MSNDIEELTALNRDYVASVQNSDVKRFDEILAPEVLTAPIPTSRWSTVQLSSNRPRCR